MTARSSSDDLSRALESYTGAMTKLMTMPIRWSARGTRGMAKAFEEAVLCGPGAGSGCSRCGSYDCCDDDCNNCSDDCGSCSCGDSRCGGCKRPRLEQGVEVQLSSGDIGEVTEVGDNWVKVKLDDDCTRKVAKSSICRVLRNPVADDGDTVETVCGFVGDITNIDKDIVTLKSGGSTFKVHRKSICRILNRGPGPGDGSGVSPETKNKAVSPQD